MPFLESHLSSTGRGTAWVPEYGRFYYEGRATSLNGDKGAAWSSEEFVKIARSQQALEAQLLQLANRVLVCDTDALATHVFHKHYLGSAQPLQPTSSVTAEG